MATPIGTNEVNSISRRYIYPTLVDNVYRSNLLFFRLNARNKKMLQGGYQIEIPLVYSRFAAGGFYQGFDQLDISPSDTVKNAAFDWKQAWVPVTVDGLTLIRTDSPEAVVNFLSFYFEQAQTELAELLGAGVWSNVVSNNKSIDGLQGAVDNGSVAATYGGLSRSTNTFWQSQVSSITPPLSLVAMMQMWGACTEGGRHPTIIVTTQQVYNLYWALNTGVNATAGVPGQAFPVQPGGVDVQLGQAGFTNLVFNGVPVTVDSHVPATLDVLPQRRLHLPVRQPSGRLQHEGVPRAGQPGRHDLVDPVGRERRPIQLLAARQAHRYHLVRSTHAHPDHSECRSGVQRRRYMAEHVPVEPAFAGHLRLPEQLRYGSLPG
jgi:hypothetical protein